MPQPRLHRPVTRGDDEGVALVTVLLATMVMITLLAAVSSYAIGSMQLSRHDQDWNASLAAAEAGVDDFLLRLNEDQGYAETVRTMNATGCQAASTPDGLRACNTWAAVPGAPDAEYQYQVSTIDGSGVTLVSTGRTSGVQRAVKTLLKRATFLDYAYFSDRETSKPEAYYVPEWTAGQVANATTYCDAYWWEGSRPGQDPRRLHSRSANKAVYEPDAAKGPDDKPCDVAEFGTSDYFDGPVRTNDILFFQGNTVFDGPVSVARPQNASAARGSNNWENNYWVDSEPEIGSTSTPVTPRFNAGIIAVPHLELPPDNSELKQYATDPSEGCRYYGPTKIQFNSGGTIQVWSPLTLDSELTSTGCKRNGESMSIPGGTRGGVIYVDTPPASPSRPACNESTLSPLISGYSYGPFTSQDINNTTIQAATNRYLCGAGNAFVGGTYNGQLTIGAANKIVVYQDVLRANRTDASDDLLGLLPNTDVEFWHPVRCEGSAASPNYCFDGITMITEAQTPDTLEAAVLAINGSVRAENYLFGEGREGGYTVTGSVAQRYRGRMSGGSRWQYSKTFLYDDRLQRLAPPRFINPRSAAWSVINWSEVRPG